MSRRIICLAWVMLLAACAPLTAFDATPPALTRYSTWGTVWTVGRAPTLDAPALLTDTDSLWLAWADSARGLVVQRRTLSADRLLHEAIITLEGRADPRAVTLHPIGEEGLLVLWLAQDSSGEARLFAAALDREALSLTLVPLAISDARTLRYSAASNGVGGLWVVWSGGAIAEPSLYVLAVDGVGRAQVPTLLMQNADNPAFALTADGALRLFWLRADEGTPHAAPFVEGRLTDTHTLTTPAPLTSTDRLVSLNAAFDRTHGYLFWNVVDAGGVARVYISVGDAGTWNTPRLLGIGSRAGDAPQVGFNARTVAAAAYGESSVAWLMPLDGVGDTLPVAVWLGDAWGAVYFQAGELMGMQRIFTPQAAALGLPALSTDRDRHLVMGWSAPRDDDAALLEVTTTR